MIAFLLAAALSATAHCSPALFAGGVAPSAPSTVEGCFTGYAVGYDPAWGEPAWSAEVITPDSARAGEATKRNGAFHTCTLIDGSVSVPPSVYAKSGFDLGHMVPAGDRGADKPETFCTANMVPQSPLLNRRVWAKIELSLRNLATSGATLYVVTGPQVLAEAPRLKGRVSVPDSTWKAVFIVGQGAAAWDCSNHAPIVCTQETVDTLAALIGFDPLPGVPEALKATAIALPPPTKGVN